MVNKNVLDSVLLKYKAQPVGWGYRDIIVKKEFVENFIKEILSEGFNIDAIGWWEYCKTMDTKNQSGMGGPKSIFFDGWFSEIGFVGGFACRLTLSGNVTEKYKMVMEHILSMKLGGLTFDNSEILVPSFDIDVPDDWRNLSDNL